MRQCGPAVCKKLTLSRNAAGAPGDTALWIRVETRGTVHKPPRAGKDTGPGRRAAGAADGAAAGVVTRAGIEPATPCLKGRCSTD